MEQYIIVCRYHYSPHATILNSAMFQSKAQALKVAEYHKLKLKTERKLSESFWKEKQATDLPIMEVVKIKVPVAFYQD